MDLGIRVLIVAVQITWKKNQYMTAPRKSSARPYLIIWVALDVANTSRGQRHVRGSSSEHDEEEGQEDEPEVESSLLCTNVESSVIDMREI